MKLNSRRQLAQVALFSLMALGTGSAFAQTERGLPGLPSPAGQAGIAQERGTPGLPSPAGQPGIAQERGTPGLPSPAGQAGISISPAQFSTSLQARERELASIEQLFTRIEAAKLPAEKEKLFNEISQPLDAYAKGMIENINTALKQAELGAKSQNKEGSTGLIKPFEDLAVKHEQRMKKLDERAQKIDRDIEKGEREPPKQTSSITEPTDGVKVARGWPMLEKISDFLIPPAHAALAIPAVGVCGPLTVASAGTAFVACLAIIGTTIPLVALAASQFTVCWNAAHNHKYKNGDKHYHGMNGMRTACTLILIAKLA